MVSACEFYEGYLKFITLNNIPSNKNNYYVFLKVDHVNN